MNLYKTKMSWQFKNLTCSDSVNYFKKDDDGEGFHEFISYDLQL